MVYTLIDSLDSFFSNDLILSSTNLNSVNLDDDIFMIVIPKPSPMLDLWLGIIYISNTKDVKKDRYKIIACSIGIQQ